MTTLPKFIDASAGTGKTYRLAWCYLAALAEFGEDAGPGEPAGHERVVACTFTVAAAAEFRQRVREFLELGPAEFNRQAEAVRVDVSGLRRRQLAASLPTLGIRTLDSLFLHLLRRAVPGTTARLPTSTEAEQAAREAHRAWLAGDPARAGRFGLGQGGGVYMALRRFAEGAEGYPEAEVREALASPGEEEMAAWLSLLEEEARDEARAALALLPPEWSPTPNSRERVAPLRAALAGFAVAAPGSGALLAKLLAQMATAVAAGGGLPLDALVPLRRAVEAVRAVTGLRMAGADQMAPDLLAYSRCHRDALENRGLLGPGGVAVRLLAALEAGRPLGEPAISWLLVDEFQDTNPLQARVLTALLANLGPEAGITVVGDEKQAIYRFRGASTGPFLSVRAQAGNDVTWLTTTWRTGPALLAAVNWLLSPFLPSLRERPPTADPNSREGGRIEPVPLTVWACRHPGRPKSGKGLRAKGDPEREVKAVARALDAVVWIREERPGESILVLGRSWHLLADLARRLAARGVPARLAGDPNLLSDPDVKALASALRVLAWPQDPVHSLAVLRGPGFAFTVAELEAGGEEVAAAREALAGWAAEAAAGRTAVGVLAEMIAATGWLEGLGGDPRAHERRLRLLEALEWLRAAEEGDTLSAAGLAELLERGAREGLRVHAPTPAAGEGVTLRTVHGAKGLEDDHVVLVDPEGDRPLAMGGRVFPSRQDTKEPWRPAPAHFEPAADGRLGGLWLPLPSPGVPVWMSPGFLEVWKEGRKEEARERHNLVYVGLTRARRTAHLVVPGYLLPGDQAAGSLLGPLYEAMDPTGQWPEMEADAAGAPTEHSVPIPGWALAEQGLEDDAPTVAFVPAALRRAAPAPVASPEAGERRLARLKLPGAEVEAAAGPPPGDPAAARGDWIHKVLEELGVPEGQPTPEWLEEAARIPHAGRLPTPGGVAALGAQMAALAALPEWQALRGRWLEAYAEYQLPGHLGLAYCDLLARTDSGYMVVDWKTGERTPDKEAEYRDQVIGYISAVRRALGGDAGPGPEVEGVVVWLDEEPPSLQVVQPH